MITRKLFQEDVYKKDCISTILDVQGTGSKEDPFLLVLDATVFFPEGGGQPCDLGTIENVPVVNVFEKSGVVFHTLQHFDVPNKSDSHLHKAVWEAGEKVNCRLDWERRFSHMQRHCGEHILSGVFFSECGGVNRGFHMGKDYMTIDIDVQGISWETAERIEMLANQAIWANLPVTVRYFDNPSEAENLPLRKPLAINEDISIVCVGDESNPADCVACCGTHPSTSGQVGLLKIIKLENYKGMTRVYFKAGEEALEDYRNKHRIITDLNLKYSSDDNDLLNKIRVQDEKNKEIRQEFYLIKNALKDKVINEVLSDSGIVSDESEKPGFFVTSPGLVIREFSYLQANDLMSIARTLIEIYDKSAPSSVSKNAKAADNKSKKNPLLVLISTNENTIILAAAGAYDCGKIIKDNAHIWRGKGGGNAMSARASFPTREDLECFVTFIKQQQEAEI
jgi:alanyl-tRNA synthetase